jgi:hypothetical protein
LEQHGVVDRTAAAVDQAVDLDEALQRSSIRNHVSRPHKTPGALPPPAAAGGGGHSIPAYYDSPRAAAAAAAGAAAAALGVAGSTIEMSTYGVGPGVTGGNPRGSPTPWAGASPVPGDRPAGTYSPSNVGLAFQQSGAGQPQLPGWNTAAADAGGGGAAAAGGWGTSGVTVMHTGSAPLQQHQDPAAAAAGGYGQPQYGQQYGQPQQQYGGTY